MMRTIKFLAKRRLNSIDSAAILAFSYLATNGRPISAALVAVAGMIVSLVLEGVVEARHKREELK